MTARLENPLKLAPETIKSMMAVEATLRQSGLEHGLLDLVKLRVSQINGCAFCLQMHATMLRRQGESETLRRAFIAAVYITRNPGKLAPG